MSAYTDFLADQARIDLFLFEPSPYDLDAGAVVTKYFSSEEYFNPDVSPPQSYEARILPPGPQFSIDAVVPGTVGTLSTYSGGQVRLINRQGDLDYLDSYSWDGRSCTVRHGGYSYRLGRYLTYAEMGSTVYEMESFELDRDEATIVLSPKSRPFSRPITKDRYRGMPWALNFNGSTNYVSFGVAGVPSKLNLRNDITIEGWFWIDQADIGSSSGLVGWSTSATTYPFAWNKTTADKLRFVDSAGTIDQTGTLALTGDRWWHLSVSISGTTMYMVYYDAQTGTRTLETYTVSSTTRPTTNGLFYIGRASTNYLSGAVQELRIWDIGLAPGVIDNRRQRTLETAEITSNLKSYLKFADGSGSTVLDSASSAANGTVNGTVAWYRSLEGDEDLTGEAKPCGFGQIYHATPTLVHAASREYQYHDCITKNATPSIFEGGGAITAGTAYTSWKTYAAATTTAGQFDTLRTSNGTYFRLGSNPSKPVTITFEGDASGSGYVSTVADITRRIVTTRPVVPIVDPTGLDTASFSALNTASSAVVGYFANGEETIASAIGEILGSVGAIGYHLLSGLFAVKQFSWSARASAAEFDERTIVSVDAAPFDSPWEVLKLGFKKSYTVMDGSDLASGSVGTTTQTFLAKEFRYVTRRNRQAAINYLHSPVVVKDSLLTVRGDAEYECSRRHDIFNGDSGQPRGWSITVLASAPIVEFMDFATFSVKDIDLLGVEQQRFGWATGKQAIVLGIRSDGATRTLSVWYPDGNQ